MILSPFRRFAAFTAISLLFGTAVRAEHPIIAKARGYLGSEAALNAVQSVHYSGTLAAPDRADPAKQIQMPIDIIFQLPFRQRVVITRELSIDTTGLDSYDGWQREQNPKDPTTWRLKLLGKEQIKRLRANTWENLAFFRGLEQEGGKVLDQGVATVDGASCRRLAFVHADDIVFSRYFDEATGRLVLTETEAGDSIREQGEIMAGGIRFPKQIITTSKGPDGKEQTVTITFDKIEVNGPVAAGIFAIPPLTNK